jgi:hypothetical protein
MSKIKVIVKGQVGSGHHRVAEAILHTLDRAGAKINVDSLDALRAGNGVVYSGMGHRVKIKVVQEPRVEVAEPDKATERAITDEEWTLVQEHRGRRMTGLPMHEKDGLYYFWCWGRQPEGEERARIARKSPLAAAEAFLEVYERFTPNGNGHIPPTKRKVPA